MDWMAATGIATLAVAGATIWLARQTGRLVKTTTEAARQSAVLAAYASLAASTNAKQATDGRALVKEQPTPWV